MFHKALRWSAWWLLLALLTYGLLSPDPPEAGAALFSPEVSFGVSKSVHLLAYALLAALVAFLSAGPRLCVALWLILAAHGAATEYLQQFVEGRSGSFTDVLIDWAGICLGLALARFVFRRRSP